MAQEPLLRRLGDAFIGSCIERTVLRTKDQHNTEGYHGLTDRISWVEFMSESEWSLLKEMFETDDDKEIVSQIEQHHMFEKELRMKYSHWSFHVLSGKYVPWLGHYRIIDTKGRA
jgi:hypothetical protein